MEGGLAPAGEKPASAGFVAGYRAHLDDMWTLVHRLGVDARDIDDVTHDVFVVAYRRWADYDQSRPVGAWLAGIACRVVADWKRSARVRLEVLTSTDQSEEAPCGSTPSGPEEALREGSARNLVLCALDALPPERRAVFVLHELEGYSMPEIAELLGVPLNTLYSRLRVGRTEFRARVRELQAEEDRS